MRKLEHLKKASLLLAVSDSSRREALAHLGVSENQAVNTSEAIDEHFRPMAITKEEEETLREKFGILKPFVLYAPGGFDVRKNVEGLIISYAQLSTALRQGYQLVIAGKISEGEKQKYLGLAKQHGLGTEYIVFTGYVSDEDLVRLYNLCELFVFPSIHEGFGLPVLEAMACGAAVIGSNTTSIPEVIGRIDALFDPHSEHSIAEKLKQVLTDEDFRNELKRHGIEQAKRFSWDESAKKAIEAFDGYFKVKNKIDKVVWSDIIGYINTAYHALINDIAQISCQFESINDTELMKLASCIEKNFVTIEQMHRYIPLPERILWRIEGPFDTSYSLAIVNRELARAIKNIGHDVVLYSTEGPGDFLPNKDFLINNPDIADMYHRAYAIKQEDAHVTSRSIYPPRVKDMKCRLNILHCYAWEESGFPQEWIEDFNQYLQGITCVSRHVKKILIDNGVSLPILVSGNGVDHWLRIEPDIIYKLNTNKSFQFLHVSSCFPRKGADVLLKAYGKTFSSKDDVCLIIKTFPNPHNKIYDWLKEAQSATPDFPEVLIIQDDLPDSQLKALYEQCHCLVAPSRAEGFGLPMAEAMISGLPIITTGWGGVLDFCTHETAWLIDFSFEYANTHFNLFDSVWAEPNVDQLASLMREVYSLPLEERSKKPKKGREILLKDFKWSDVANRLVESARLFSYLSHDPKVNIGWISTWNMRCGIAIYSEYLIRNLDYPVNILAPVTIDKVGVDQDNVKRCWRISNDESLSDLESIIDELNVNTIVLQFNYGFFNLRNLDRFIRSQIAKGRIFVITLHSTSDPEHDKSKKLEFLKDSLVQCHRILVHSLKDLNRLKALGLVENVTLFPHGVVDIIPKPVSLQIPPNRFVIGSYGFFLPNKGLLELIEAVSILVKSNINIHLIMVNAEYPIPESRETINEAKKLIQRMKLKEKITMITDFLPDEESLGYLSKADLIIFPYQKTGESSSAAIRYGIASKKPVAVTPLSIFEDVSKVVYKLPGIKPEEIALGIKRYIESCESGDSAIIEIQKRAEEWRQSHLYRKIGKRLSGMLLGLNVNKNL
jgi:glycosyltransferase involved in cell wall biosynthesis